MEQPVRGDTRSTNPSPRREDADRPYGKREGRIRDPFGHLWVLSTTIEQLSPGRDRKAAQLMKIKRIVSNIAAQDVAKAKQFYGDLLGLRVVMDMGWIATFEADASMRQQLSVAAHGGSATPVPDLTIEVDDLQEALRRFQEAEVTIEYGPATEPWGVRRFYVRDPFGRLLNVMQHTQ